MRTEVVTEVKCPAGTHRVGDGCAADVSTQCASGLRFVDGQGCMPNLVAAAPSAPPSSATPAIDRAPLAPDEAAIRKSLEPKVWSGKGSRADITMLKVICMHMGDRPCRDRADAMLKAKAEGE